MSRLNQAGDFQSLAPAMQASTLVRSLEILWGKCHRTFLWPWRQNWYRSQLHLKDVFQAEWPLEGVSSSVPVTVQPGTGSLPLRRPQMGFLPWEGINNSYHLFCLFHVSSSELSILFSLLLTLTTTPSDTCDPFHRFHKLRSRSKMTYPRSHS